MTLERTCTICGATFETVRETRVTCGSPACHAARNRALQVERDLRSGKRKARYSAGPKIHTCRACGATFEHWHPRARACSPGCLRGYINAVERRRRGAEETGDPGERRRTCPICGRDFVPIRGDRQVTCGDPECQDAHMRRRRGQPARGTTRRGRPRSLPPSTCEVCGITFAPARRNQVTCGAPPCRYASAVAKIKARSKARTASRRLAATPAGKRPED